MTEQEFRLDQVDFDGVYRGASIVQGTDVGFRGVPWDIGAPQPVVVRLAESGGLRDDVLDAGCGLGENAIFLAAQGHRVTGVDGSGVALESARARAAERGVAVEFVQADATTMAGVPQRFNSVLDSALYHCLTGEQRDAYARALAEVTLPGATLHLFCFSDKDNEAFGLPIKVSEDDLREHLSPHWTIRSIEQDEYTTAFTPQAWAAGETERLGAQGITMDTADLRTDEQGRIVAAVWHVTADRA